MYVCTDQQCVVQYVVAVTSRDIHKVISVALLTGTFSWTFGYHLMFVEPLHVWIVWWAWNRMLSKSQRLSKRAWLPWAAISLRQSLSAVHEKLLHMQKCSFHYTALMPLWIADYHTAAFINVGIPECLCCGGITASMILFYSWKLPVCWCCLYSDRTKIKTKWTLNKYLVPLIMTFHL